MATKTANLYARIEPDVKIPTAKQIDVAELIEVADIRKDYGL